MVTIEIQTAWIVFPACWAADSAGLATCTSKEVCLKRFNMRSNLLVSDHSPKTVSRTQGVWTGGRQCFEFVNVMPTSHWTVTHHTQGSFGSPCFWSFSIIWGIHDDLQSKSVRVPMHYHCKHRSTLPKTCWAKHSGGKASCSCCRRACRKANQGAGGVGMFLLTPQRNTNKKSISVGIYGAVFCSMLQGPKPKLQSNPISLFWKHDHCPGWIRNFHILIWIVLVLPWKYWKANTWFCLQQGYALCRKKG